jgi:ArsR family transcriptional regulator
VTVTATRVDIDEVFKALASEHRRTILRILGESMPQPGKTCCLSDEVCACKISERLGLAASTTSHHMAVLKNAGLVSARKDGLWTYYTLQRDALAEVAVELQAL